MKYKMYIALFLIVFLCQSFTDAIEVWNENKWGLNGRLAVEGTIATGGSLGIGLTYYAPRYELGVAASGDFNNAQDKTKLFIPVVFGGLRKYLNCDTVFAYGINVVGIYGKIGGSNIDFSYISGFYLSLEYYLSTNVMLVGWIDPYAYETTKLEHSKRVNTNHIFSTGGIGLAYFW